MIQKTRLYVLAGSMLVIVLSAAFLLFFSHTFKKNSKNLTSNNISVSPIEDSLVVSMAVTGDIMGHLPLIQSMYQPEKKMYDYTPAFQYVAPFFLSCDVVIGNLEVTLAGPPYTGYPMFSSPDDLIPALQKSGYNFLITANNHSYDKGKAGLIRTLHVLDSLKMRHTGTFRDTIERDKTYPYLWEVKQGFRMAILNYTYGTNGLTVYAPNVVNLIDTAIIRNDLLKAKKSKPDFILVTFHWGIEYQRNESIEQQRIAQFCADHGADAIVGAHPHVVQPMAWLSPTDDSLKKVPVFYSLGNFLSNQRDTYRDGGIIGQIIVVKKQNKTYIHQVKYIPTWVYKKETYPISYTIIPVQKFEKSPDEFHLSTADSLKIIKFGVETRKLLNRFEEAAWNY
ncbi:MAG: CapA family protein [Flavobacteriales bacterium]|nr:CapA family protein [Flavobacteriales bacterium]